MALDTAAFALPAVAFVEATQHLTKTAFRTGGQPLMPEGTQWPQDKCGTPFHYFGEIELQRLPQHVEVSGTEYPLPAHPREGRLLIFLPMSHDVMEPALVYVIERPDACILHPTPEGVPLPETCELPIINENYLAKNRREFLPLSYHPKQLMSKAARNPLTRDLDMRNVSEEERHRLDLAFAEQLSALGIYYEVRPPRPIAAREALFNSVPYPFDEYFEDGSFEWTWDCLFAVCKRALLRMYELAIDDFEIDKEQGRGTVKQLFLVGYLRGTQEEISKARIHTFRHPLSMIKSRPSIKKPIDRQLKGWMSYASKMRKEPFSEEDKRAFVQFLCEIEYDMEDPQDLERPPLKILQSQKRTQVTNRDVRFAVHRAFRDGCKAKPAPQHSEDDDYSFEQGMQVAQMFGSGYLCHDAAIELEGKVPLLQLSDAGGLALSNIDGFLQIWIDSDDLAAGDFYKAFATTRAS